MKRRRHLGVLCLLLACPMLPLAGRQSSPAVNRHYRLIQVVGTSALQEKINDAAAEGYRLAGVANTPSGSTAAILRATGEPGTFQYQLQDIELGRNSIKEFPERLNGMSANGFRLYAVLAPLPFRIRFHVPPAVLVMEKQPGKPVSWQYETVKAGLDGFKKDKIAGLLAQGYQPKQTAWVMASELIFEREAAAGAPAQTSPATQSGECRFLVSNWFPILMPEKQILKAAAAGFRVIDVFYFDNWRAMAAVQQMTSGSSPYGYRVLKPKGRDEVSEDELNRAGADGFRLVRLRTLFGSFLAEKTPGSSTRFKYRILEAPTLAELATPLEQADADGYEVAVLRPLTTGFNVVLEKEVD